MTPEEVEDRLRTLEIPKPPGDLRERCVSPVPGSPRSRVIVAVAASLLAVSLVGWFLSKVAGSSGTPGKAQERPADRPDLSAVQDDPVLLKKVERLLRDNPGKAVLVVRVKEFRDRKFIPVAGNVKLKILLQNKDVPEDVPELSSRPSAAADSEGTLLYVASPGRFRGAGFHQEVVTSTGHLKGLGFVWEFSDLELQPGKAVRLSDAVFAPPLAWSGPVEGLAVSGKDDLKIGWAPYPALHTVKVEFGRVKKLEGGVFTSPYGSFKRACPEDNVISFSDLRKVSSQAFEVGDRIGVTLTGYDREGNLLTRTEAPLEILIKD